MTNSAPKTAQGHAPTGCTGLNTLAVVLLALWAFWAVIILAAIGDDLLALVALCVCLGLAALALKPERGRR